MRFNPDIRYEFSLENRQQSERLQIILFRKGLRWRFNTHPGNRIAPQNTGATRLIVISNNILIGGTNRRNTPTETISTLDFLRYTHLKALLLNTPEEHR